MGVRLFRIMAWRPACIEGIVPFVVELCEWRTPCFLYVVDSMLRHMGSNHAVRRGQRVQGSDQVLQIAVAPDPPEVLLRLHQRARHPALNHLTTAPALDVARGKAESRRCTLKRVAAEVRNVVAAQRTAISSIRSASPWSACNAV